MVFVVGVGWQYGPGASGGSLGMGFLGVRRWGCGLGLDGVLVTLGCCFSGGGMRRCWDACAGERRLPAWRPHCSGLVRGGVWGSGRSASGLGLRLGLGGLGPGWCAAGSMGWCMRLGPALVGVFDASVPPRGGRGGGPIEAGYTGFTWVSYCLM